jgi:integrase
MSKPLTVRAFAERWVAGKTVGPTGELRPADRHHKYNLSRILPELGDIPLTELTHERVTAWRANLQATELSVEAKERIAKTLASMMRAAVRESLIERSPCRQPETPVPELKPARSITRRKDIRFADYVSEWIQRREASGARVASTYRCLLRRMVPVFGPQAMCAIRPAHVRSWVAWLTTSNTKNGAPLSSRTVGSYYRLLHVIFNDALADEIVEVSPCVLRKGRDLPSACDKDPTWRAAAVFSKAEVEAILSASSTSDFWRALFALLFTTGARLGEVVALRFNRVLPDSPLPRVVLAESWNWHSKKLNPTKTGAQRSAPLLPEAELFLNRWRSRWAAQFGRDPQPGDLIFPRVSPTEGLTYVRHDVVRDAFHTTLARLGLRRRRVHDARRSFVSLAIEAGARREAIFSCTHARQGDILSSYTEVSHGSKCAELGKLRFPALLEAGALR